nr:retinal guanylyl cyclase 2-like isoform X2 [Drosophila bipectinata]
MFLTTMPKFLRISLLLQIFFSILLFCYFVYGFESVCTQNRDSTLQDNNINQLRIGLQVTNNPIHQVMTRILYFFLINNLNYKNVYIIPIKSTFNEWKILESISQHATKPTVSIINMPGHYGWIVPFPDIRLFHQTQQSLRFNIFNNISNTYYDQYVIDEQHIRELTNITSVVQFKNPKCVESKCVTILAEFENDTSFIKNELIEMGLYVNVIWLGNNFKKKVRSLIKEYAKKYPLGHKRIIILHWLPSEMFHDATNFAEIIIPKCKFIQSLNKSGCKYEYTSFLKYYSKNLESDLQIKHALNHFYLRDEDIENIWKDLESHKQNLTYDLFNIVACHWLLNNTYYLKKWEKSEPPIKNIFIGGIFPLNVSKSGYENLFNVSRLAAMAINNNQSILPGYNLKILASNGQCQANMVLKSFIHYYTRPNLLGILGPACSETVEPIVGIGKHMNMIVMSYSAESVDLVNSKTYPYFFRTIGSHLIFIGAYLDIMKVLDWSKVSFLYETESVEYISTLEENLKQRNFTLTINIKIDTNCNPTHIKENLQRLNQARSKIIIANLYYPTAAKTICEALKLKMTQQYGYIWFLPHELLKDFYGWQITVNDSCSAQDFHEAVNGHFSIMHTPFFNYSARMQEGRTIKDWKESYRTQYGSEPSSYSGFTYDAVWTYALAAHKLLLEDKNAFNNLRTAKVINKFSEIIWETRFNGLSGNVYFTRGVPGGSRALSLDLLQWRNTSFHRIGTYESPTKLVKPGIRISEGNLFLNMTSIYWPTGRVPEDGRFDCRFSILARLFNSSCDTSLIIVTISFCIFSVSSISFIFFFFFKHFYKRKLKRSAQIMKLFGIDILSPTLSEKNTLDKWEIAKENVVINRRLGEGAFGMVYGGEAKFSENKWIAVAVKTLKSGQSTEDRIDFLTEAEAMKKFDHNNIIKLLGVCLQSEPIYTVMEFMLHGDLKTFLLARRNLVRENISDESDISPKRLTLYAIDIANGLAYLAKRKYVHRDIACRNCLVNFDRVVKISDFGMARPTFESDYYRYNRKGMRKLFPVRWMPPETLSLGLFTTASDIWSYGVVLYELISFGAYPYQGLTNNQVLDYVKSGNTINIPSKAKPQLERLIQACWSQDAAYRPSALEIIEYISKYPRLLNACLDIPPKSINMKGNKTYDLKVLDKIIQSSEDMEVLSNSSLPFRSIQTTLDGYSIMTPLLTHQ